MEPSNEFNWEGGQRYRLENLLQTEFMSDLTLIIGHQREEIKVHKFILSLGSPVFYARIKSLDDSFSDELAFPDSEVGVFKRLLQYIYTDEVSPSFSEALPLLYLASELQIPPLVANCARILKNNFADENILMIFQKARQAGHMELMHSAMAFICLNAASILKQDEFANLPIDCVIQIVKRDDLEVNKELDVFQALLRWGTAECGRRNEDPSNNSVFQKVLKDILPWIRFPLMAPSEFAMNVSKKRLLPLEDVVEILSSFNIPAAQREEYDCGYSSKPRNYKKAGAASRNFKPDFSLNENCQQTPKPQPQPRTSGANGGGGDGGGNSALFDSLYGGKGGFLRKGLGGN